jgi:hypothetical protein
VVIKNERRVSRFENILKSEVSSNKQSVNDASDDPHD